jgi:hypothetical protein
VKRGRTVDSARETRPDSLASDIGATLVYLRRVADPNLALPVSGSARAGTFLAVAFLLCKKSRT